MGNFRDGNRRFGSKSHSRSSFSGRGGSRGGFGGGDRGRSFERRRGPVEMHDAVCDKCKSECRVPFMPSGSRPVLCSNCFEKEGGSGNNRDSGRSFGNRTFESSSNRSDNSAQFKQIEAKLDKIIGILQELELDAGEDEEDLAEDSDNEEKDE